MKSRVWILVAAIAIPVVAVFFFPAIPKSEAYHNFADKRMLFGVPNALDALSNIFFLFVGFVGMKYSLRRAGQPGSSFVESRERWSYFAFFVGVALTAFGSTYYHLHPNDSTLVWDRLPMAIAFMALVAAVVSERLNVKLGVVLLTPLVALGITSVLYWHFTQDSGHGDLRPYAVAQFGSLLAILLMLALFQPRYTRGSDFIVSLGIYGLAKVFEAADRPIFALGHIVSGHTLKHLVAALSAYWIARMLRLRAPVGSPAKVQVSLHA
jgi:hypothetical protein